VDGRSSTSDRDECDLGDFAFQVTGVGGGTKQGRPSLTFQDQPSHMKAVPIDDGIVDDPGRQSPCRRRFSKPHSANSSL
jgi:hypothetical protein